MATNPGKWQVAGKPSKIPKKRDDGNTGKRNGVNISSLPTIDQLENREPVRESPTIYDAFIEKENVAPKPKKPQDSPVAASKKSTTSSKKKSAKRQSTLKMSLEEALKRIEIDTVLSILEKDRTTFPDNPSVWLMDLVTYINCNLDCVNEPDPVLDGRARDYPISAFPTQLQKVFEDVLRKCPEKTQKAFMEACIKSMVNDLGKGISTYGFRIVIQLLARFKPAIIENDVPKYLTLLKETQSRSAQCLSVMWALSQVGYVSLKQGINVWFELLIPFLNIKSVSNYVVDYIGSIFKTHQSKIPENMLVSVKRYFALLDLSFNPPAQLSTAQQKKLRNVYPQIKALSLQKSKNSHRVFFPSYLARLSKNCNQQLKNELCECLVECLQTETQCYSVWRQMYVQHQHQSCQLLKHVNQNWGQLRSKLDKAHISETVTTFRRTNEDLQKKADPELVAVCTALQERMTVRSYWWLYLLLLTVTSLAGLITWDLYRHESMQDSTVYKYLADFGVLTILEQAGRNIKTYSGYIYAWLQMNVPYYYGKTAEFVQPYLVLFWQKLYTAGVKVLEVTEPVRAELTIYATQALQWLSVVYELVWTSSFQLCALYPCFRLVFENVNRQLPVVYEFVRTSSTQLWALTQHYLIHASDWLQANVFTGSYSIENIGRVLGELVQSLQSYVLRALQYLTALLNSQQATNA